MNHFAVLKERYKISYEDRKPVYRGYITLNNNYEIVGWDDNYFYLQKSFKLTEARINFKGRNSVQIYVQGTLYQFEKHKKYLDGIETLFLVAKLIN